MVGWHHQLNKLELEPTLEDSEGQGSLACCSPWGPKDSHMPERLNSKVVLVVKNPPANAGDLRDAGSIPASGHPLEEVLATHLSILA